jgi:acetyl esterase/lipase
MKLHYKFLVFILTYSCVFGLFQNCAQKDNQLSDAGDSIQAVENGTRSSQFDNLPDTNSPLFACLYNGFTYQVGTVGRGINQSNGQYECTDADWQTLEWSQIRPSSNPFIKPCRVDNFVIPDGISRRSETDASSFEEKCINGSWIKTIGSITYDYLGYNQKSIGCDFYYPYNARNSGKKYPTVVLIHGGGWFSGSKSDFKVLGRAIALAGFFVFSIDYSLADKVNLNVPRPDSETATVPFLNGIADVHEFFLTIANNALNNANPEFQVDPDKISIMGASAGAYMAMIQSIRSDNLNNFKCIISAYGPSDLYSLAVDQRYPVSNQIIKGVMGVDAATLNSYSPQTYTEYFRGSKLLVLHATNDNLVPISQSQKFVRKIKASRNYVTNKEPIITEKYVTYGQLTAQTADNFGHGFPDSNMNKIVLNYMANCK